MANVKVNGMENLSDRGMFMNLANFRDLGGLPSRLGKAVKSKQLLRSGEVVELNAEASQLLKEEYQLGAIIDLRGAEEIRERPDDVLENVDYHWIDIMKDSQESSGMEDFLAIDTIETADRYMLSIYDHLILNKVAQAGYRTYFETLLSANRGSTLFHCFAGKDRTGIAAALTLEFLEVPRTHIYRDYLETNVLRAKPNQELIDQAVAQGATELQQAGLRVALEVKSEYLDHAYHLIDTQFGGISGFANDALG